MLRLGIVLFVAVTAGCATASRTEGFRDAELAYWAGEERVKQEEWSRAIALFRRAAVDLPASAQYDEARHDLVMRIAHVQVRAFAHTRDAGYLADAAQMLSRYAEHDESRATQRRARELEFMSATVASGLAHARREGLSIEGDPSSRYPDAPEVAALISAARVPAPARRRPASARAPGPLPVDTYVAQRGSDEWRTRLSKPIR